jgi:excisionase family DNA binding protein
MSEFMSPVEAAELLRVHPKTVYLWLASGRLRAPRAGRRWLITRAAIDEFIAPPPVPSVDQAAVNPLQNRKQKGRR